MTIKCSGENKSRKQGTNTIYNIREVTIEKVDTTQMRKAKNVF